MRLVAAPLAMADELRSQHPRSSVWQRAKGECGAAGPRVAHRPPRLGSRRTLRALASPVLVPGGAARGCACPEGGGVV